MDKVIAEKLGPDMLAFLRRNLGGGLMPYAVNHAKEELVELVEKAVAMGKWFALGDRPKRNIDLYPDYASASAAFEEQVCSRCGVTKCSAAGNLGSQCGLCWMFTNIPEPDNKESDDAAAAADDEKEEA